MSAKTYNELRNAVKRFSRVTSIDDDFDTIVELAEDEIYKTLRVRELITSYNTVLTIGASTLALPTGFLEAIPEGCFTLDSGVRYPIEYRLDAVDNRDLSGRPSQFTVVSAIEFDVKPDSTYAFVMRHFARPTKLTESAGTNAILTAYPSIYFYALMWQVSEYSKELEQADREKSKMDMAIAAANKIFKDSQFGPAPKFAGVQHSTLSNVTMRGR